MKVLYIEALFHSLFFLMFFVSSWSLWRRYKINGNLLAKYLSLSFLFGGLEYVFLTMSILVFPYNVFLARILGVLVANPLFYIAMMWIWLMIPYMYPSFPGKVIIGIFSVLFFITLIADIFNNTPFSLNSAGIVTFSASDLTNIIIALLMLGTIIPVTIAVVLKSFEKKLFFQAVTIGVGMTIQTIFMPFLYQAKNFG